MTDKEQIVIDGANILDCDNYYIEQETDQVKCDLSGEYCRENKNCMFKQLARKTQECEELKKKFSKFFNIDNQECWDIAFLKDENARYRKALEEIEEILDNGTANININAAHLVHKHYLARFCDIRNIISNAKAITT